MTMQKFNAKATGWCPYHEKFLYRSRKDARQTGHRQHRSSHKTAYPCEIGPDRWHYGELTPDVLHGRKTRSQIYNLRRAA